MKKYSLTLIVLIALLILTDCKKEEEEVIEPSRAPTGTFTDPRDRQVYNTIDIGTQVWFAENLNYETSNSHWYDNDSVNGDIYGRLYNLDEALNACPTGWHLPNDAEWTELFDYLGGAAIAGGKIKEVTYSWRSPNYASNESGFSLVELMVVTAFLAIILSSTFSVLASSFKVKNKIENQIQLTSHLMSIQNILVTGQRKLQIIS